MRIGLYQDPRGASIGGGEYCIAVLAHALFEAGHDVELVQHQGEQLVERLAEFFHIDLEGIGCRTLPHPGRWHVPESPIWMRGKAMRRWLQEASEAYDLFVCVTHTPPPFNRARFGVAYVLFPNFDLHAPWTESEPATSAGRIKEWLRKLMYKRWWHERIETYDQFVSISEFTRKWTTKYWEVDSKIIYPPVDVSQFAPGKKEDRILILGRFTLLKNQTRMLETYRRHRERLPGWSLACVGGLVESKPADCEYFATVKLAAAGIAELLLNVPRGRVCSELARARIFWHAMGIDVDEELEPIRQEHFGIATVEAMAAGCVPIVANCGGQTEIVTDGETGFLCNSLDEFVERTIELAKDTSRAKRMAAAARDDASKFSRSVFEARMMELLSPFLDETTS